ncbi:MAG: sn-glycerol-3-phosphate ABC transporter ATP-binding protein UgpC [Firmicutes bacterium]|nr:sn-glycerol-3-phosphate ABC transporter ATP-binding protein UgpC [Bacillota bacterium]
MARVVLEGVTKRYGSVTAVNNANLVIEDEEFVVLVGPSGCGKSTTLRMVAGLEDITEGNIYIGDRLVNDVPPKDRDIAMVFQNYALYPHMDVYNNMAFGLKLRRFPKAEIDRRVREAARMLGIEDLLHRKPKQLSGGQRQRVAVGRAIVREPAAFLMDEPLSNLDAKLRVQMRAELSKLHNRLRTTTIYVTHDQTEAMTMGDRIVVMKDGFIQQVGAPLEIYENPNNVFVAGFIGSPAMNFLNAVLKQEGDDVIVDCGAFNVRVPESRVAKSPRIREYLNKRVIFGIRPEDIDDAQMVPEERRAEAITARVDVTEPMGSEVYVYLSVGEHSFIARFDSATKARDGEPHQVVFNMDKMHLFDAETELAIR